jgi:hypothetical protein
MEEKVVDVFLGVPIHDGCNQVAAPPWPILEVVRVRAWINRRTAVAALMHFEDDLSKDFQPKGRGGAVY